MSKTKWQPAADDKRIREITTGIISLPSVLVAHEMGLFTFLEAGGRSLKEICAKFDLQSRAAEALVILLASLDLLQTEGEKYSLSPIAKDFLLPGSPASNCGFLDFLIKNRASYSFDSLKEAIRTNQPQLYGAGRETFADNKNNAVLAGQFTAAMHSVALAPSSAWPSKLNLSKNKSFLDIAGGSGQHSLAVCREWENLQATVFDLASVTKVTEPFIAKEGMSDRVKTLAGDMFKDKFPSADVNFYSNIFHDWSREECLGLARKSFESMPAGGRIVLHEIMLNDEKNGPFVAAATNITMLLWYHTGKKYSAKEFCGILEEAGFGKLEVIPSFGYWSLVTGIK